MPQRFASGHSVVCSPIWGGPIYGSNVLHHSDLPVKLSIIVFNSQMRKTVSLVGDPEA